LFAVKKKEKMKKSTKKKSRKDRKYNTKSLNMGIYYCIFSIFFLQKIDKKLQKMTTF